MTKGRWIGLGVGMFLILALFGVVLWQGGSLMNSAGVANAQAPATPTSGPNTTTPKTGQPGAPSDIADAFWNSLAQQLGLNVTDLKSKMVTAEKAAIDQAVKDGKLTQDKANNLKQKLDANPNQPVGPFGFFGRGFGRGPANGKRLAGPMMFGLGEFSTNELEAAAKVLNLQPADLASQLKSGKTLADIATAQKVDQSVVKNAIIDAIKADVERMVTDGVITRDRANQIESNLTPDKIDLTKVGLRFGMKHP